MSTEAMKLQEIMSQAQVFASAWSLVGGRFDGGNAMDEAEVAKNELHQMVAEALAQPQQEPVASKLLKQEEEIKSLRNDLRRAHDAYCQLTRERNLPTHYTSPPARKPLTDEQIVAKALHLSGLGTSPDVIQFARAIEAAHGIKEKT